MNKSFKERLKEKNITLAVIKAIDTGNKADIEYQRGNYYGYYELMEKRYAYEREYRRLRYIEKIEGKRND